MQISCETITFMLLPGTRVHSNKVIFWIGLKNSTLVFVKWTLSYLIDYLLLYIFFIFSFGSLSFVPPLYTWGGLRGKEPSLACMPLHKWSLNDFENITLQLLILNHIHFIPWISLFALKMNKKRTNYWWIWFWFLSVSKSLSYINKFSAY